MFWKVSRGQLLLGVLLTVGVVYRLLITANGNFIFNMDNARDFVDVREMVVLSKLRLIGPTSAIEGVYNGPGWYYLLAIPFLLSQGNPYSAILLEIILWVIGGIFLVKLTRQFGFLSSIFALAVWIVSNYIVLANLYSFNPNPVTLLTPVFIYTLERYLTTEKPYFIWITSLVAGLFFQLEMNIGIFTLPILFLAVALSGKSHLFKEKSFWLGIFISVLSLLPQIIFDFKHQFIMSKSLFHFLSQPQVDLAFNPLARFLGTITKLHSVLLATLMNLPLLTNSLLVLSLSAFIHLTWKRKQLKTTILISLLCVFIPLIAFIFLPVTVNPWHLGEVAVAMIIISSFSLSQLLQIQKFGTVVGVIIFTYTLIVSSSKVIHYSTYHLSFFSDVSVLKNEIGAIDYVYSQAQGSNFRVYSYLPSVYDYPYQYLFWWYGLKKYGYLPTEYSYSPNKPNYIPSKSAFSQSDLTSPPSSDLVFLIKQADVTGRRHLWENEFTDFPFIRKEAVGPLEIEIRKKI